MEVERRTRIRKRLSICILSLACMAIASLVVNLAVRYDPKRLAIDLSLDGILIGLISLVYVLAEPKGQR